MLIMGGYPHTAVTVRYNVSQNDRDKAFEFAQGIPNGVMIYNNTLYSENPTARGLFFLSNTGAGQGVNDFYVFNNLFCYPSGQTTYYGGGEASKLPGKIKLYNNAYVGGIQPPAEEANGVVEADAAQALKAVGTAPETNDTRIPRTGDSGELDGYQLVENAKMIDAGVTIEEAVTHFGGSLDNVVDGRALSPSTLHEQAKKENVPLKYIMAENFPKVQGVKYDLDFFGNSNAEGDKPDIGAAEFLQHTHKGGTATCRDRAVCEVCGKEYGTKDASNHTGGTEIRDAKEPTVTEEGYTGDTYCKGCGVKLSEGEAIDKLPEKPDGPHTHTGGTATCTEQAVCEICGEAYGTKDPSNHAGGTEIRDAKEATAAEEGYTGDTYCKGCGVKISEGKVIVAAVTAAPASGEVASGTGIALDCITEGATIYYTDDGTKPDNTSRQYTDKIIITREVIIKAVAVKEGCEDSKVAEFHYTVRTDVEPGRVSPVYTKPSHQSAVMPGTKVSLCCDTVGAEIYYTLDGTSSAVAGIRYGGDSIVINEDTTIIAIARKDGYTDSREQRFDFVVNEVPVPDIPGSDEGPDGIWIAPVADQSYTGSNIKPAVYVYDGKKLLTEKKDYTVAYKNNKNPGTAQIVVTGKGNYTDKRTAEFAILRRNISDPDIVVGNMAYADDGKQHKTVPVITHNGKKLKSGKDFEVIYGEGDYTAAGKYGLTINGIGNYQGSVEGQISIVGKDKLLTKAVIKSIPAQPYNKGNEVKLQDESLSVSLGGQPLQKDKDYTVRYANNRQPGKASVIIEGIGVYAGTKTASFKIVRQAVDINGAECECTNSESFATMAFVKGGCTPRPVLTYDGETLRSGTDYTVSYKNNKKVGETAVIVVRGKGNFKGKKEIPFTIVKKDISQVSIYVSDVPYTGKPNKYQSKPVLTDTDGTRLKAGTDYTVEYLLGDDSLDRRSNPDENAVITVKISAKGKYYDGSRTAEYQLKGTSIKSAKISINNKVYTGNAVTISQEDIKSATIKVKGVSSDLIYGVDYEVVSYSKNVKKGTATVVFCGKGNYSGEKSVKFKIVNRKISGQ